MPIPDTDSKPFVVSSSCGGKQTFRPGELSTQAARDLIRMQERVERLERLNVAQGGRLRIHRGAGNMVIELLEEPEGSGSGDGFGDLQTVQFTYLSDVTVTAQCTPNGGIQTIVTKTFKRTSITGPDLTITTIDL